MLVLGGGPGGYSAAFRAADLGLKVVIVGLIDRKRRSSRSVTLLSIKLTLIRYNPRWISKRPLSILELYPAC